MPDDASRQPPPLYPPTVTPPPRPQPLWSNLRAFVDNPLNSLPIQAYTDPITVFRPTPGFAVAWVSAPALIEQVLVSGRDGFSRSQIEKRLFQRLLGEGVLTAEGPLWRWQRRVLAPLFRHQDILSYVPAMSAAAREQLDRWRAQGPGLRPVDQAMTVTTFAVIARTMLAGGEPRETDAILANGKRYLSRVSWEIAFGILRLPEWLPHPGTWRLLSSARRLRESVLAIVMRRRAAGVDAPDLLGRLLAARDPDTGEPMSDAQLVDNMLTLLEAGHETTAKALTWTLYLLARAPEWQRAVRAEVADVAGSGPVQPDHVDRLAVTQRVLKEGLRLYPSAPVIARTALTTVKLGDEWIPAGSQIIVPIYAVHRHRALWADPDRFDPDRFLPEKEETIYRTQFMPFGAGPRICLGQAFAMVEATVLLAELVRGADFAWDGRHLPEPISRVTLQPKGGMPLRVATIG